MSIAHRPSIALPVPPVPQEEADPWRYGWRFVKVPGSRELEQVPLTEDDVLHPEEGDFIVNNRPHHDDCEYLCTVFKSRLTDDPTAVVLSDHRVDWNLPGVRALGPDVAVFRGVDKRRLPATLHVGRMNATPLLVVEITSPETVANDHGIKKRYYHRARVPLYVIVDPDNCGEMRTLTITALRRGPRSWIEIEPDAQGRVPLEGLGLLLGSRDGMLRCWNARTGEDIGDYTEVARSAEAERQRAEAERRRAEAAESRVVTERNRAEAERQRAEEAEQRIRELEKQLKNR